MTRARHWQTTAHLLPGALSAALLVLAADPALAATEVNTCGQVYGGSGFLAADLDCTGFPSAAVTITGGSLDLRGFTLTAGTGVGVYCDGNCLVQSTPAGGRIINAGDDAVTSNVSAIRVSGVELDGNFRAVDTGGALIIEDSIIANSGPFADIDSGRKITIRRTMIDGMTTILGHAAKVVDSQITNCGQLDECLGAVTKLRIKSSTISGSAVNGVRGSERLVVSDSTISGHAGHGIATFQSHVRAIRTTVTGNGGRGVSGGFGGRVRIKDSDISANALEGVLHGGPLRITGSTVTANGRSGVSTGPDPQSSCLTLRLSDSTVTGNGTDLAVCGVTETCADVAACGQAPVLNDSTCDTSYDTDSGFPGTSWGVCALD